MSVRLATRRRRPPWMEETPRGEAITKAVVLVFVVLVVVYPFWTVLATSLSSEDELRKHGGLVLIPTSITLRAYDIIFNGGVVQQALKVSIGVTVIGTILSLITTVAMAYGLSRPTFFSRPVVLVVILTLFFAPGIIPLYLLVKEVGLINSYPALILPVLVSAFNLIVIRQFFMSIPRELIDSAKIDGASELAVLFRITLPLSKAVVAVITLFYAVYYWNSFFSAILYLNDVEKWPLQLVLRQYVLQGSLLRDTGVFTSEVPPPERAVQMAVVVIATLPILVLYPFLQRYFTAGVLRGAIKG